MIQELDDIKQAMFMGIVEIENKEKLGINELINIYLNLKMSDYTLSPAKSDKELGEFYVLNELCGELEKMSDSQLIWVQNNIDFGKVGKTMREENKGILTPHGYFEMTKEIQPLYDGKYPTPTPADYVFKLLIGKIPTTDIQPKDEDLVELKLPASNEQCRKAIKQVGATSLTDCVFYELKSTIPQLNKIFSDMNDIESLNQLSITIEGMKEFDDVTKYKAMLSTIGEYNLTLETALEVSNYISQFDMEYSMVNSYEYARGKLQSFDIPMKEEFIKLLNIGKYGEILMKNDGVELTPYGMLVPLDGITLKKYMEQTSNQGITMGGLSQ